MARRRAWAGDCGMLIIFLASAWMKLNGFSPDGSVGPADSGGVAVICWLGKTMSICWAGEMGLALSGVSGYVVLLYGDCARC